MDARATEFEMMPHGFMMIYWIKDKSMNEAKECVKRSTGIVGELIYES